MQPAHRKNRFQVQIDVKDEAESYRVGGYYAEYTSHHRVIDLKAPSRFYVPVHVVISCRNQKTGARAARLYGGVFCS